MLLSEYLSKWDINPGLKNKITKSFTLKKVSTGSIILNMGENTGKVYLILQGIVRGYYLSEEGKDVTKCFSAEGDWCGIYNYLTQTPSSFYVETLEECLLAEISVENLKNIIESNPEIRNIYDELYKNAFLITEEKGCSFQMMSGKERYIFFVSKYPDIAKRVKQEYIALYIGITPSSLSRIKREL